MKISSLAENLIGSEIIKIGNEVNELKSQGQEISNLTIGDLNSAIYPIPQELKEGISRAYAQNLTNYPPANGLLSLRNSISNDIEKRWNLKYGSGDILVAGGSRPLIYAAYKTLVDPAEKVVYPVPSWNNNHYVYLSGATPVEVKTDESTNFLPTASQLRSVCEDAVLLTLCSPQNPTGTMYTEQQLSEICQMVLDINSRREPGKKPLYLLYDQIYSLLTFGKSHVHPVGLFEEMRPYTVYIDGSSKCFAATGVRVGWAFGPKEIMDPMKSFLGHVGAWAPKPEQHAMGEYLAHAQAVEHFVSTYKKQLQSSLSALHQGMQELKSEGYHTDSIEPMGALYLTVKLDYLGYTSPQGSTINTSSDLVFYLIKEAGVALVPFSAFGAAGDFPWFRASVGAVSKEEIEALIPRLQKALSALAK